MGIHAERVKSEYAGRALPKFNINADSTTNADILFPVII